MIYLIIRDSHSSSVEDITLILMIIIIYFYLVYVSPPHCCLMVHPSLFYELISL